MPREFIPCLYHEWEGYDMQQGTPYTCYQVLELLPVSDVVRRQEDCLLTRDCHQYMLEVPHLRQTLDHHAQRRSLFAYLYETLGG